MTASVTNGSANEQDAGVDLVVNDRHSRPSSPRINHKLVEVRRNGIEGWFDCDNAGASRTLVVENNRQEELPCDTRDARESLARISPTAVEFVCPLPLRFAIGQRRLRLSFRHRDASIPLSDFDLPVFAASLDHGPLAELGANGDVEFLTGWAMNAASPGNRALVRMSSRQEVRWEAHATFRREDIAEAADIDGFVGFRIPFRVIRRGEPWTLSIGGPEGTVIHSTETQ